MVRGSRTHQTSRLPHQRVVYGPFGEIGYVLRKPGYVRENPELVEIRTYNQRKMERLRSAKALKREAFMKDIEDRLELVKVRAAAQRVVDLGMKEAEIELELRKNKLRKALLEDESKYVAEYTDKAQTALERLMEETKRRVERIEKEKKVSDSIFAQKAYERMAMENDEKLREELRMKRYKNLAECVEAQMCEKEYARMQEESDDRIWNGMYEERVLKEKQTIENDKIVEARKNQEWVKVLDKQIESEEWLKDNQRCLERIVEDGVKEYAEEKAAEYDLRDQMFKDRLIRQKHVLERQIAEKRRTSERDKQEEVDMERILMEDDQRKVEREEAARVDNRNQMKAELGYFKEATVQYRNARARDEAITQHMIDEDKKRMDRNYLLERKNREMERRKFSNSCVEWTKRMVAEKAAREAELKAMDVKLHQLLEYRNEVNTQLDREKGHFDPNCSDPKAVVLHNQHNEKYLEILRERQRLEDQDLLEKMRRAKDKMQTKIRETMTKPLQEILSTSLHPFYAHISSKSG